jgi:hypothetical protein
MEPASPKYPFEVGFEEVQANLDTYVSRVFSTLKSEFLVLPKGEGFVEYPQFEQAYEALKKATGGFESLSPSIVLQAVIDTPLILVVLRTMLGFTPPELAYVASQDGDIEVAQGFVRSLDRRIRMAPLSALRVTPLTRNRLERLVVTACRLLTDPPAQNSSTKIHRLNKADTREGINSVRAISQLGVPYAMLLYERFLGRPFAGHRDSVSELVGDVLESAIEDALSKADVSYRKTKRAEKISGFDQTPDFIIPSEFNPQAVIEAKLTEDDGTARDKVTRVQHLAELSERNMPEGTRKFEVIACIGGRGFGVRREDMRKLLLATRGKVFTLKTLDRLVGCSRLGEFAAHP